MKTNSGCRAFNALNQAQSRSRRNFLQVGVLSGLGLTLGDYYRLEAAQKHYESREGKAKSVIQIFLPGGCAHQESWDPKPEAPIEYRGPFGVAKTNIPGVVFSENMKECAKIADKLCVVRSLTGKEADHGRATYAMMTGYRMSPALQHPSMGAVVSHELGGRAGLPAYTGIPNPLSHGGTGYLSSRYGAFGVGGDPASANWKVRDILLPGGISEEDFKTRRSLRDIVDRQFKRLETDPQPLEAMDSFYQQAYTMISSQEVRDAFALEQESKATRERYGEGMYQGSRGGPAGSQAGNRLLLARRLVEAGARFVSVNYGAWDTHTKIRENINEQLPAIDRALAALVTDLDERGLLDTTLVWLCTEFGRSPKINASAGRDHYARVFSGALAGGGIQRGAIYGGSNATASEPERDPVSVEDLHTTIYHQIGINADKELMAAGARPIEIVDGGKVVEGIIT